MHAARFLLNTATIAAFVACRSAPASAPSAPAAASQKAPNPCETEPAFSQFDFWVGDWDVFDPAGVKQGRNQITKAEGGCLLIERWRSARGTTGQSYNFYDPITKKWRQVWVSRGMSIDYVGGVSPDGSMVLTGEIHYHQGQSFPFRGRWTPLDDGAVRQHFEQFDPDKQEWATWFTGIYRRRAPESS